MRATATTTNKKTAKVIARRTKSPVAVKTQAANLPVPVAPQSVVARPVRGTRHGEDVKRRAVALLMSRTMKAQDICAKVGVSAAALYAWRKQYATASSTADATAPAVSKASDALSVSPGAIAARDATVWLRQAKKKLIAGIRAREIDDFDEVHLLSMLALRSLTGGDG